MRQTERLRLRELTEGDEEFLIELLNEPGFLRNIGDRGVRDRETAQRYVNDGPAASYVRNGFGLYCVEMIGSGERLGICGLLKRDTLPHVDIGFAFLERHQGRGFALEAARATMDQARDLGLERVVAITVDDNQPSIRLLEKLGMKFERVVQLANDPTPLKLFSIDLI